MILRASTAGLLVSYWRYRIDQNNNNKRKKRQTKQSKLARSRNSTKFTTVFS